MQGKDFTEWAAEYMVCTDFAAAYKRENPQAVIKFGHVDGDGHAWVYDPETDRTLDATLSQWAGFKAGCEEDDWWPGDDHPVAEETKEYDTVEAFAKDEGGTYLLN
ncbi:hypothetical protein [Halobaculum sp. EA56]|uniref:hypothetical protein n=1 Tax=Halobaculum sp. EA56 TaxID=3421648 RepID=UPI003EB7AFFD